MSIPVTEVAFDFDSCLFPFDFLFRSYLEQTYSLTLTPWEDITAVRFDVMTGHDQQMIQGIFDQLTNTERYWRLFHSRKMVLEVMKEEELKRIYEALNFFKTRFNFRFSIITARSKRTCEKIVKEYCDEWFPGIFEEFHFCEHFSTSPKGTQVIRRTKREVCARHNIIALIDDNIGHVKDLHLDGRLGILFGENPWTLHALKELKELKAMGKTQEVFYTSDPFEAMEGVLAFSRISYNTIRLRKVLHVGLSGFGGCGKDTVERAFQKIWRERQTKKSFAGLLRYFTSKLNPVIPSTGKTYLATLEEEGGYEEAKRKLETGVRQFLIDVGHGMRVNVDGDFWIKGVFSPEEILAIKEEDLSKFGKFLASKGYFLEEHRNLPPLEELPMKPFLTSPELLLDVSQFSVIFYTDVRYENEEKEIHKRGGIVIGVTRPGVGPVSPTEEESLKKVVKDFVIENDGTLEALEEKVSRIASALRV